MSSATVYVNDSAISETEVYHARRSHATDHRWTRDRSRETTVQEARDEGLRPCKVCFPGDTGSFCPGCGQEGDGDDVLAHDQRYCANTDCRVVSFSEGEEQRGEDS